MKSVFYIKRAACVLCALCLAFAAAACTKSKNKAQNSGSAVTQTSIAGKVTSKGYELPYTLSDGSAPVAKIVDGSVYKHVDTQGVTNPRHWLTTDKSVEEVQKFFDDYFKTLQPVKAKLATDESVAYYDKDRKTIISNLSVWKADGVTNYQFGVEACESLEDSPTWEAK